MSTRHLATLTKHHENSSSSLTLSIPVQILMASSYVFMAKMIYVLTVAANTLI